ncbi:glutamyl-tRNA(Gln) amidotransferase subunit C, mitochondrial-like [Argiope bruennichi]|uniref:glutamyl-tRNA(Gln) amidotransferase subunit C, mitochondrial-like n=1 Tax=Argiope bruennichi TaxID=94029 RepID=UPI0024942772|nr:glutamyl-tRNA(Gln) amidotransferase subunit C, mitochondrial-like [Argiope bruennichi]
MRRSLSQLLQYSRRLNQKPYRNFGFSSSLKNVKKDIVESLERLALVDFSTEAGIQRLEQSIKFADKLMEVDTSAVEPVINTVYNWNENLRDDEPIDKSYRKELMEVCPSSEEFYYVAPLGTFSRNKVESD